MIKNDTIEVNALLKQLIDKYEMIESLYYAIDTTSFNTPSGDIDKKNKELSVVFQQIAFFESILSKQLAKNTNLSETNFTLIKERECLLNRVYKQNRALHCKAGDLKALVLHELNTVSIGCKAIKCYKPAFAETKGLISNSC